MTETSYTPEVKFRTLVISYYRLNLVTDSLCWRRTAFTCSCELDYHELTLADTSRNNYTIMKEQHTVALKQ